MRRFDNQVVLITGGTSGIGFASAKAFLDEGARLIITGQNQQRLDEARQQLGGDVLAIQADMRSLEQIAAMAQTVAKAYGQLDVVFLNAGVSQMAGITEVDEVHFDEIMNVNFKGTFFTIQHLIPLLKDSASIILNTSVLSQFGIGGFSVLSASKAALRSLARSLTLELAGRCIRVNMVSPGAIATPLYEKLRLSPDELAAMSGLTEAIPLKRFGEAEEVAKAVLFLASPEAAYINGEELNIDGGLIGK